MSDKQKAKARLRIFDDENPIKMYVKRLERELSRRPKKTDKIMRLKSRVNDLEYEVAELKEELLNDRVRFQNIKDALDA